MSAIRGGRRSTSATVISMQLIDRGVGGGGAKSWEIKRFKGHRDRRRILRRRQSRLIAAARWRWRTRRYGIYCRRQAHDPGPKDFEYHRNKKQRNSLRPAITT